MLKNNKAGYYSVRDLIKCLSHVLNKEKLKIGCVFKSFLDEGFTSNSKFLTPIEILLIYI